MQKYFCQRSKHSFVILALVMDGFFICFEELEDIRALWNNFGSLERFYFIIRQYSDCLIHLSLPVTWLLVWPWLRYIMVGGVLGRWRNQPIHLNTTNYARCIEPCWLWRKKWTLMHAGYLSDDKYHMTSREIEMVRRMVYASGIWGLLRLMVINVVLVCCCCWSVVGKQAQATWMDPSRPSILLRPVHVQPSFVNSAAVARAIERVEEAYHRHHNQSK